MGVVKEDQPQARTEHVERRRTDTAGGTSSELRAMEANVGSRDRGNGTDRQCPEKSGGFPRTLARESTDHAVPSSEKESTEAAKKLYTRRGWISNLEELIDRRRDNHAVRLFCNWEKKAANVRNVAAAIFLFSRRSSLPRAERVFESVRHTFWMHSATGKSVYDAMLRVYAERGESKKAMRFVRLMLDKKVEFTAYTYNSLLRLHTNRHHAEEHVQQVLNSMEDQGISLNTESFNELLRYRSRSGNDPSQMISIFEEMFRRSVDPSAKTFTLLMTTFERVNDAAAAEPLFRAMLSCPLQLQDSPFLAMLRLRLASGDAAAVLRGYEDMRNRGLTGSIRACQVLREACEVAPDPKVAKQLLRAVLEMKLNNECKTGVIPLGKGRCQIGCEKSILPHLGKRIQALSLAQERPVDAREGSGDARKRPADARKRPADATAVETVSHRVDNFAERAPPKQTSETN